MYGLSPEDAEAHELAAMGFEPVLEWLARPTLVKRLPPGASVGYSRSYVVAGPDPETIAVLPVGYAGGGVCAAVVR
jgi:alanine racemase